MIISIPLHVFSYIIYITRPVTDHPNYIRLEIRSIFPKWLWRGILCRWIYSKIKTQTLFLQIMHMFAFAIFTLYFGISTLPKVSSTFPEDKNCIGSMIFVVWALSYLAIDILILECLAIVIMAPAVIIGFIVYLFSLWWCPAFAVQMRRRRTHSEEERVDRDFFKDFQSDHNWQEMLLFIFKHNKIIFHKEDFKDHYEEQNAIEEKEESKNGKSQNIIDNMKAEILEDIRNCKH